MVTVGDSRPLTSYVGAEISGINLKNLDESTVNSIWRMFLKHQVIFFRNQTLSPGDLVALGKCFGKILAPHAGLTTLKSHPDVMLAETRDGEGFGKYNTRWHSDVSFEEMPPAGSIIQAVKVPDVGGDTLFSSMYAAYENLALPLKEMVRNLKAFHEGVPAFSWALLDPVNREGSERLERMKRECPGAVHPVVRCHPETGRKALFVNRSFTTRILGLSEIESRNLIDLLCEHCEQAAFQVRWRWAQGDVGIWDNRCLTHCAVMDYGKSHRIMHRITLRGDRPL